MMNSSAFGQFWPTYYPFQPNSFPQQFFFPPQMYSCLIPTQGTPLTTPALEGTNHKQVSSKIVNEPQSFSLSQVDDSQESKSYQPRRKSSRPQKNLKKKLKIKPERNALTNIGNQILTFIYLRKKNQVIVKTCFPDLTVEQLHGYYAFAKEIKLSMYGYINYDKLALLWHQNEKIGQEALNYQILRTLSLYYIRDVLVRSILTSRKMPVDVKPLHLKVRRKMLSFLSGSK